MTRTLYTYHPAYQQGRSAYTEGTRRAHNPHSGSDDQAATYAWWQGWDDEADAEGMASHERSDWCDWPDDDGEPDFTLDECDWDDEN